ncbi:MAG TPA: LptF/LptG family permease [candidate division Zixibacteria bacterium]|jgi:lipopolysaccharide export system permease protein
MKRIDRYLIGKFFFNLAWAITAFWAVFLIVDLVENLDKFIDKDVPAASIALYYYFYSPYIVILIMPIGVLLATLFAVGFLAKRNELLAMRAAGLSLWRLAIPFLSMGLLVVAGVFVVGETVYPEFETRRGEMRGLYIRGRSQQPEMLLKDLFVSGGGGRVYFFKTFNTRSNTGVHVSVQTMRDGRLVESIEAKEVKYTGDGWVGTAVEHRIFSERADSAVQYAMVEVMPFPEWTETPEDMVRKRVVANQLRYGQLQAAIVSLRRAGNETSTEETELALRLAFPFINLIVILIGFPIASRTRQTGMALNFGIAMMITFVVRVLYEVFRSLGHNGELEPWLAAWGPNVIALVFGVVILALVRK